MPKHRVCIVGAGSIAVTHAEVLRARPDVTLSAIVDSRPGAARKLAHQFDAAAHFESVEDAISNGNIDRAHVLVPPDSHAEVAAAFLQRSIPVFVEKPMAATSEECESLIGLSQKNRVTLGINHNFVRHPAFRSLARFVEEGRIGRLQQVHCTFAMPLRQLSAGQFGHWMFRRPENLLLEQAIHPLSQIAALTGSPDNFEVMSGPAREIAPQTPFISRYDVLAEASETPILLSFAVGRSFPVWRISAIGTDGEIIADMVENRVLRKLRTRWIEPVDHFLSGMREAGDALWQSGRNVSVYGLSTIGIVNRADPFFRSMQSSIGDFHDGCGGTLDGYHDPELALKLVRACESIARAASPSPSSTPVRSSPSGVTESPEFEVLVIGGTGFIGKHVIQNLCASDRRVGVLARSTGNLPHVFSNTGVTVVAGDAADKTAVERAINGARVVVNLAHGGGGANYDEISKAMEGSARAVAEACLAKGVERLIHVSSIAALYLGDDDAIIADGTEPDPESNERADYARVKAETERKLAEICGDGPTKLCILRPGLVVGKGSSPFHSGVGVFNNEQHCLGWNDGRNPLPFVLVEDVADAIVKAIDTNGLTSQSYNLVGDVRLDARTYIRELAAATGRPLRFHPQSVGKQLAIEWTKWAIKRIGGRSGPRPSRRDIRSRGLTAKIDCSLAKSTLGWTPVASRAVFLKKAVYIHGSHSKACDERSQ